MLGKCLPKFGSGSDFGFGQAEESPPPTRCSVGGGLSDPQHQREDHSAQRGPRDAPGTSALGIRGIRNHRACLTSCCSQTHWHFFPALGGNPSCSLPVRGVGEAGACRVPGNWPPHHIRHRRERRSRRRKEAGLSSPGLDFIPSWFQVF